MTVAKVAVVHKSTGSKAAHLLLVASPRNNHIAHRTSKINIGNWVENAAVRSYPRMLSCDVSLAHLRTQRRTVPPSSASGMCIV